MRPGAALCVDSIPEKNSVVDNIPWRLAALENKFLNFYIMHKSSEVLPAGRLHRLWLAGGESLQKPSQLLAGKRPYLRSVPRPLEFSIVQAFCAKHETRLVKVQGLERISFPAAKQIKGVRIRVHLVSVPDQGHKAVKTAPHISAPSDDINFRVTGQCT